MTDQAKLCLRQKEMHFYEIIYWPGPRRGLQFTKSKFENLKSLKKSPPKNKIGQQSGKSASSRSPNLLNKKNVCHAF